MIWNTSSHTLVEVTNESWSGHMILGGPCSVDLPADIAPGETRHLGLLTGMFNRLTVETEEGDEFSTHYYVDRVRVEPRSTCAGIVFDGSHLIPPDFYDQRPRTVRVLGETHGPDGVAPRQITLDDDTESLRLFFGHPQPADLLEPERAPFLLDAPAFWSAETTYEEALAHGAELLEIEARGARYVAVVALAPMQTATDWAPRPWPGSDPALAHATRSQRAVFPSFLQIRLPFEELAAFPEDVVAFQAIYGWIVSGSKTAYAVWLSRRPLAEWPSATVHYSEAPSRP
ncbi:MAG: hypothetical protein R3F62_27345 [Planctomycetota bacterium]